MARSRMEKRSNTFVLLAVIFLILGIVGLCVICGMFYATYLSELEYGVVFDAGSSHTSLYLYKWGSKKLNNTGKVQQLMSCEVKDKGLSSYQEDPKKAGASLEECMDNASKEIPFGLKRHTPVYLGATAGMRIIRLQSPKIATAIFSSVQNEIKNSGFQVTNLEEQVKILTGKDEGIGLWVTANYVGGTLGNILSPEWSAVLPVGISHTIGVLDLGGASTQVAFALRGNNTAHDNDTESMTLFSKGLKVFSASFLCFGAGEMRKQVLAMSVKKANYEGEVIHPCLPDGYSDNTTYTEVFQSICTKYYAAKTPRTSDLTIVGSGNNTECSAAMAELFSRPLFTQSEIPTLPDRLLARGAFYYTPKDLNVLDAAKQTNYTKFVSAMNERCSTHYSLIRAMKLFDPLSVCTNAHYMHHLLSKIYKIHDNHWSRIVFTNKIKEVDMGWTLGYMTNITSALPRVPKLELFQIGTPVFIVMLIITSALIVLGIIAIVLACRYKRKQYQSLHQQFSEPF